MIPQAGYLRMYPLDRLCRTTTSCELIHRFEHIGRPGHESELE